MTLLVHAHGAIGQRMGGAALDVPRELRLSVHLDRLVVGDVETGRGVALGHHAQKRRLAGTRACDHAHLGNARPPRVDYRLLLGAGSNDHFHLVRSRIVTLVCRGARKLQMWACDRAQSDVPR